MEYNHLIEVLQERAAHSAAGVYFIDSGVPEEAMSYSELYQAALEALGRLQAAGLRPGDELVFQLLENRPLVIVFWACILGGIIPVPLKVGQTDDHREKLFNIWPILDHPHMIASAGVPDMLERHTLQTDRQEVLLSIRERLLDEALVLSGGQKGEVFAADKNDLAFIQFSSGSTGQPKGVKVTHGNLLANMTAISIAAAYEASDRMLSWMPLTHDMGLIGFHLNPVLAGIDHYLMSTQLFIRRPALWLDKASEHRITVLCSPNFGYEYVLRHCMLQSDHQWDLSAVRLLYNGAEPISSRLCRRFLEELAPFGLRKEAICPVYGLAEGTLAVTISKLEDTIQDFAVPLTGLNPGDRIVPDAADPSAASAGVRVMLVNVGSAIHNCELRIADDKDRLPEELTVGHIHIKGPGVTSGYYNNPAATAAVLTADGWLRTGDLGFIKDHCLYITGRAKDLILVNGQNYYPHDLERIAEELDGVELNKIVFAGFFNAFEGKEEVVAFLLYRGQQDEFARLAAQMKELISQKAGLTIDRVIRVKDIPRTTSGKLQRFKLVQQLLNNEFDVSEGAAAPIRQPAVEEAPVDQLTRTIGRLFKQVLKKDHIGNGDDFFGEGGNSLKAAELSLLVWKELEIDSPMELVYEKRSIREFSRAIREMSRTEFTAIPAAGQRVSFPLTQAQRRIYYAWELEPSAIAYNLPVAFHFEGRMDTQLLETCIQQLITRYDLLRASFQPGEQPSFRIAPAIDFLLPCGECRPVRLSQTLKEAVRPFDLHRGPLFRAQWWSTGAYEGVLFLDFHHIISDGVSVSLFFSELMKLYDEEQSAGDPLSYGDYACWEMEYYASKVIQRQKDFWLQQFSDELPLLELPGDRARPVVFDTTGSKTFFRLTAGLPELRYFLATHQCPMHVFLFASYTLLLSKYSGQDDVIVGIPVAGRRHPDIRDSFGMFVNNLPIRVRLSGKETFRQLLQRLKKDMLVALSNQDYPFGQLVEALGQRRAPDRSPLFDTMFIYQNMDIPVGNNGAFRYKRLAFDPGFSKFDLSLEIFEEEGGLSCACEYALALFKPATIDRMIRHFDRLVTSFLEDPDRMIAEIGLWEEGDADCHLPAGAAREEEKGLTIHQLFERQVDKTPEAIALSCKGETLTYRELNTRADKLAAVLTRKGVSPDQPVAILMDRSPELIVAILGILKAGGCYLPIEKGLPAERIGYLLSDSCCRLLLVTEEQDLPLPVAGVERLDIRQCITGELLSFSPEQPASPENLAYIIYTSGTTGMPKGVMITQRSLVNYSVWAASQYIEQPREVFALFTSISFDLTVTSIFPPLITGQVIEIYPESGDQLLVETVVADNKATILKLTPSHLRLLANGPTFLSGRDSVIRCFIVGGENLDTALAKRVEEWGRGRVTIYNEYGPTEATVGCMIHPFDPAEGHASVPIGLPAANTEIYVLDPYLNPVAIGVRGEIYIAGVGLASGYYDREELTRQRFVSNPFREGQKMYRTGDIGRRLPEGVLAYEGRVDQQVKINGYRIELQEIGAALEGLDIVKKALVIVRKDGAAQPRLLAYYILSDEKGIPPAEALLRAYLANRLPYYMIPVRFVPLDHFPLTRNGKIDQAALPDPIVLREELSPVADPVAQLSVNAWREVLGIKAVGIRDNFFELGGDSIKAVQIVARLALGGISLKARDILTYQTIEQIGKSAMLSQRAAYQQGLVSGEAALTPIQEWFFRRGLSHPGYYNHSLLLRLRKPIRKDLLSAAFRRLVARHDGLRINVTADHKKVFYNPEHLHAIAGIGSIEGDIRSALSWKKGFDLYRELLIRAVVLEGSGSEQLLLLSAHHLVVDGISWRILLEDFYTLYNALEKGEEALLPPKTASQLDWEQAWNQSHTIEKISQWETWKEEVIAAGFSLVLDHPTTDWTESSKHRVTLKPDRGDTSRRLLDASLHYRSNLSVILLTVVATALQEWTGLSNPVIHLEEHGRNLSDLDLTRTIGWFTALYPVVFDLEEEGWAQRIKAVQQRLQQVPLQGLGYPQEKTSPEIGFNYLGQFGAEFQNELFDLLPESIGLDSHPQNALTAKLDFTLLMLDGELHASIDYNAKAFDRSSVERLSASFINQLEHCLASVSQGEAVSFAPSDFELIDLDQKDLDALFG